MTDLVQRRPAVPRQPGPARDLAGPSRPQPADPPSVHRDGVALGRLLARAQLTVAQTVELAAAVSAEAVRRSAPAAGSPGDQHPIGPLVIGADGRVVAGAPARSTGNGHPAATPPAGPTVGDVLAEITAAVRSRARRAGPAAEELVAELDGAVTELPLAGVPAAARRLRELAAAVDRGTVRAELGALVTAIGRGADVPVGGPTAPAPATVRGASRRPSTGRRPVSAARRIGAWLVSLLVLAGVVVGEVGALRDHIAADIETLLDAGRSESTPSAAPEPVARPLPAPAPAAAGEVAAIELRALSPCAPGAACTVRLQVRLAAGTDDRVVRWSYRLVDRCTGATVPAPGGSVAVPAGAPRVQAAGVVALPAALPAVAVFARTDAPAVAASAPVLVGSCPPSPATR